MKSKIGFLFRFYFLSKYTIVVPILTDTGVLVIALTMPDVFLKTLFKSFIFLPATTETIIELPSSLSLSNPFSVFN